MKSFFLLVLLLSSLPLAAQDSTSTLRHSFTVAAAFTQLKEGLNQGLVFGGPGLLFRYDCERYRPYSLVAFQTHLGAGVDFREGMIGLNTHLRPFRFFYGKTVFQQENDQRYYFGGAISADYNYQLYPQLHSGISFWFTHFSLSPEFRADLPLKNGKRLRLQGSTSLFSLTSRPETEVEPYFFSFKFGDIVSNLHHEMTFGSLNLANQTTFSVEWLLPGKKRDIGLAYSIEYFGYYKAPKMTALSQFFQTRFYFKQKK